MAGTLPALLAATADADVAFTPTPFQRELAEAARAFLQEHAAAVPTQPERSADPSLWAAVGRDLGWVALVVSEGRGGMGGHLADLRLVLEEAGRVLLGVPFADTAALAHILDRFGSGPMVERLVPRLAAGELVGTIACGDSPASLSAEERGGGISLSGEARWVVWGGEADVVMAFAGGPADPVAVLLEHPALGAATVRRVAVTDHTRPVHTLVFERLEVPPSAVLARGDQALRLHDLARVVRSTMLACESVGGADEVLRLSVDYAGERRQFGRPIGSFQAVKHRLADMLRLVEHARTAATVACAADDEQGAELVMRAAVAKSVCDEAFVGVAAGAIQVHGGIGFTTEHPAHLYYKRASVNAQIVWPATACRAHLRDALFGVDRPRDGN